MILISMNDPIECAGIVLIKDNKVLLVKHGQKAEHLNDTFGVPGGRLDPGESHIDCAIREFFEETNLIVKKDDLIEIPNDYVATIERKTEGTKTFSMKNFKCNNFTGDLISNEEADPVWTDLSELDNLNLLPNVKEMINDSLNL